MKQIITLFLFIPFTIAAATVKDTIPKTTFDYKNEARIDITRLIANASIGLSYERFINKDLSAGLNVVLLNSYHLTEDDFYYNSYDYINNFQVNPYVRLFFHQRSKKVFFAETFITYHSGNYVDVQRLNEGHYAYYAYQNHPMSGWGGGVAIGGKYYLKKHYVIELITGVGFSKINNNQMYTFNRSGVNVGYRF